jgi:heat shock protein 5
MPRKDVALLVRAFVWLLALVAALGKASALLDHDWPPDPATYPPGRVVAIDLGNTNSCVAGYESGETTRTMFHHCIPSWVAFADDGTVLVGEDAMNHAAVNPGAAVSGFKRLLGKR